MKLEYGGLDWLLTGEPRPGQTEALCRSYTGYRYRDDREATPVPQSLAHVGHVARGWGHWMQMRVGKTPTLLNEYMLLKRDRGIKKMLVLSPNNFKWDWAKEHGTFGVDVPVYVHDRDKVDTDKWCASNKHEGMLVVNYEGLIQTEVCDTLLRWVDETTLAASDESVKLKNPNATTFKRALNIFKQSEFRRTLTGKPAPQSPMDYYAQLRMNGALNGLNQYAWKATYCKTGGFRGKQIVGIKNPERLADVLNTHVFMAERKDWADYHESDYQVARVEMSKEQTAAYKEMERDYVTWLSENESVSVDMAAHVHTKLQQISSGFIYNEQGETRAIMPFDKTNKFRYLLEHIEERTVDKVLIVFYYKPVGDALMEALQQFNPAFIGGKIAMSKRGLDVMSEKERFNNEPSCRLMVAQETAVKYGHTLMGTEENPCLDLVFYENSYSLDDRAQVEERPQGNGQLAPLSILDFYSSPVEEKVVKSLQAKENVSQAVVRHYKDRL